MLDKTIIRRERILEGNIWIAIITLGIPAAINDFIRAMYSLIDTIFVANIGSMEIAAITFVGPINTFVRTMSIGLSVAGTNLIAREIGREDYQKAKRVIMQLLVIGTSIGVAIAVISVIFSEQILVSASATQAILPTANDYFRLTALSSPFVFINSIYVSVKRAEGDIFKAMRVNTAGMILKIILTYLLIFQFDLGLRSLAISTIIGTMFVSGYALYDLFYKPSIMKLSIHDLKFSRKFLIGLAIIAIPVIIEKSSISFSFIVLNKYVISHGENVLASYGITNRVNSMFFATVTGFASGLSPIISQNLAVGQANRAREASRKTFVVAVSLAVIVMMIFWPLKGMIAGYFAKGDPMILYHTLNAMGIYSVSVIPWALFQVANGVFQGTGHTKYNMVISIMRIYLFRLPIVIILSRYSDLGEFSIWYAMLFSNLLTGLFALCLYLYRKKDLRLAGE